MVRGRKKNPRCTTFSPSTMICRCFGPLTLSHDQLKQRPQIILSKEETQSLVDKDICGLTMDVASAKMGVSKTVYAGIYASARTKLTQALIEGEVIHIECDKSSPSPFLSSSS